MRFSKEHNFELKSSPQYSLIKYKLFHSAALLHKRIFSNMVEFYLFGKFRVWTIKIIENLWRG
ncbi:MAG: hypothetical protein LBH29_02850 [Elusimicrobiota bacterium]|jgi:hypothetical protein|nr:hypothetical protein [Elusimicrobiota bacterium]